MSAPATPPVWNVRIVSCVPGSPIDCAAMMPDRVADLAHVAGREEGAVAGAAHAELAAALEHRAHRDVAVVGVLLELLDDLAQARHA